MAASFWYESSSDTRISFSEARWDPLGRATELPLPRRLVTTTGPSPAAAPPLGDVVPCVVQAAGVPVSALAAAVPRPRVVVVALHGGAATSAYYDHPGHPRLSLLRTGTALGFTVLALDRPGYGSSAGHTRGMERPERRVEVAYAAVEALLAGRSRGAGVFLVAHSIGCELAVRMAADERGADLLGVELAGTGTQHNPPALRLMEEWRRNAARRPTGRRMRDLIWYPADAYPPDVYGGARIGSPAPAYEGDVVRTWTEDFPRLAARVRVPLRFTLGAHEQVWRSGPTALADIGSLFTASPRVVVDEQAGAGHNTSIGRTATAYHLKVLSFVEECALAARPQRTEGGTR
ncbi:alpha/beta hydrolase [Streptomyces sp. PSKA28]|uniref:Alpha/beta hydrolase n=1 Tax=Streptomyces himalayensis subsp. himalayensis TaxID=2756131 RepID=A0A7W0DMK1_9ACTN|nr:alpha/beta hydrolase [Streptomyces himalayensis subsp. himalayensis]